MQYTTLKSLIDSRVITDVQSHIKLSPSGYPYIVLSKSNKINNLLLSKKAAEIFEELSITEGKELREYLMGHASIACFQNASGETHYRLSFGSGHYQSAAAIFDIEELVDVDFDISHFMSEFKES